MTARKVKISVSIDAALLANVDRYASTNRLTRSAALERWLGQISHKERLNRLEEETAAYYDSLTDAERRDDDEWTTFAMKSARKLNIDDDRPAPATAGAKKLPSPKRRR